MRCPVCSNADTKKRHTGATSVYSPHAFDLDECSNCSHIFTSPAPTSSELAEIYGKTYGYEAHQLIQNEKRFRGTKYADVVAGQIESGKVLEIGCMHGYLLSSLKDRGYDVTGIELDPEAAEYAKSQGLNVTQSSLENFLENSTEKFDVIFMSHVLEHIADPKHGLEQLKKHLTKNGKLIVVVPNSHSASAKLFGKFWGYWQVPVHINHFNAPSISHLFKHTGYKIHTQKFFGGDSLLFLSTLANFMRVKNTGETFSPLKKKFVQLSSAFLQHWHKLGGEDMLVVAGRE